MRLRECLRPLIFSARLLQYIYMEKQILNYRVIIEPEKMGRKTVYNAYCPTLSLADYGDTIEEVLASIREAIELRLEVLNEEGEEIPVDLPNSLVTQLSIKAPKGIRLATP